MKILEMPLTHLKYKVVKKNKVLKSMISAFPLRKL